MQQIDDGQETIDNSGGKKKELEIEFKQLAQEHSVEALQTVISLLNDPATLPSDKLKAAELIMGHAWYATQHIDTGLCQDIGSEEIPAEVTNDEIKARLKDILRSGNNRTADLSDAKLDTILAKSNTLSEEEYPPDDDL